MESGVTQPQPEGEGKPVTKHQKPSNWDSYTFRISAISIAGGVVVGVISFAATKLVTPDNKPVTATNATPAPRAISKQRTFPVVKFVGVIKPDGGVIEIAAPANDPIQKILVREGDFLRQGQPVVELASFNKFQATLDYTKSYYVTINRLKTCPISSLLPPVVPVIKPQLVGNKSTKPAAKKSDNVCFTPVSYEQMQSLVAEMPKLEATIAQMTTQIESSIIRSPRMTRVLKVLPPTNDVTQNRILLGDTRKMYALARVPLDNFRSLKLGLSCKLSSPVMQKAVDGKLTGLSNIVTAEGVDVSIAIANPKLVSSLTNLPVDVICNL